MMCDKIYKNGLYDSELKVLEVLWAEKEIIAKDLSIILEEMCGWQKSTAYTVIRRMAEKGLILRSGKKFTCQAAITREEALELEIDKFVDKLFGGSKDQLVASLLGNSITQPQIAALRQMVQEFAAN